MWNKNGQLGDIIIKLLWVIFELIKFENFYYNQKLKNIFYDGGNKNFKKNIDK